MRDEASSEWGKHWAPQGLLEILVGLLDVLLYHVVGQVAFI